MMSQTQTAGHKMEWFHDFQTTIYIYLSIYLSNYLTIYLSIYICFYTKVGHKLNEKTVVSAFYKIDSHSYKYSPWCLFAWDPL